MNLRHDLKRGLQAKELDTYEHLGWSNLAQHTKGETMDAEFRARTKKNRILSGGLSLLLVGVLLMAWSPVSVFAVDADSKDTDASVTFTGGSLTLDKAPQMDFGSHLLSANTEQYGAAQSDAILISDIRGSAAGWKLTVALSNFQIGGTGPQTLLGSYVTITSATIKAENGTASAAPTIASSSVRLDSDNTATLLLKANAGSGSGVWSADLSTNPTLTVFPGATIGTHSAKLTWVLEDTP